MREVLATMNYSVSVTAEYGGMLFRTRELSEKKQENL